MCARILALACLVCVGHSRRVKVTGEREKHTAPSELTSLTNLLHASAPQAAFSPHGLNSVRNPLPATGRQQTSVMKPYTENVIPFLPRPAYLDDSLPADIGFDPLGLAVMDGPWWAVPGFKSPKRRVAWMREAELKHGRLAMLAAAGWPISELAQGNIAETLELPYGLEATGGRVPSVLNGNLGSATPVLVLFLLVCSYLEVKTLDVQHGLTATGMTMEGDVQNNDGTIVVKDYCAGDYEFDPLGLHDFFTILSSDIDKERADQDPDYKYQWIMYNRRLMEAAEVRNGRLAMMAITSFAIQEAVLKTPVVDQTPILFTNAWDVFFSGRF